LAAANVAALPLGGLHCPQQPFDEGLPSRERPLIRRGHRRPAGVALEQVALHAEAVADKVPAGGDAFGAGVGGRAPVGVDHAELAHLRLLVPGH